MVEPVNLIRFRKAQKRAAETKQAAENRVAFGRGKARRQKDRALSEKTAKDLENKKLD